MQDKVQWEIKVPIFKNSLILKQLAIAIGIPFGILIILLIVLLKGSIYALYSVGTIVLLLIATWIFILIVYGGTYDVEFLLNDKGVLYQSRPNQMKKNKIINSLTFILGLLSKNPTSMGASTLAQSRQQIFVPWKKVVEVKYKPKDFTILIKSGFAQSIALFCREENYPAVKEFVIDKCHIKS